MCGFCKRPGDAPALYRDRSSWFQETVPLLAIAESISDVGGTSVKTCLSKGKKLCAAAGTERNQRKCERKNCADIMVREEGGEGGSHR